MPELRIAAHAAVQLRPRLPGPGDLQRLRSRDLTVPGRRACLGRSAFPPCTGSGPSPSATRRAAHAPVSDP